MYRAEKRFVATDGILLCQGPQSKDFVAYSYLVLFVFTIFKNIKPFIVGAVYIK